MRVTYNRCEWCQFVIVKISPFQLSSHKITKKNVYPFTSIVVLFLCVVINVMQSAVNRGYAQQTSVLCKRGLVLLVQVFCMCFVNYGAVLLKMPSKELPKMSVSSVHQICRVISESFLLLTIIQTLKVDAMRPLFWFGHVAYAPLTVDLILNPKIFL